MKLCKFTDGIPISVIIYHESFINNYNINKDNPAYAYIFQNSDGYYICDMDLYEFKAGNCLIAYIYYI